MLPGQTMRIKVKRAAAAQDKSAQDAPLRGQARTVGLRGDAVRRAGAQVRTASCSVLAITLKPHRPNPGHSIAVVRAIKSSLEPRQEERALKVVQNDVVAARSARTCAWWRPRRRPSVRPPATPSRRRSSRRTSTTGSRRGCGPSNTAAVSHFLPIFTPRGLPRKPFRKPFRVSICDSLHS